MVVGMARTKLRLLKDISKCVTLKNTSTICQNPIIHDENDRKEEGEEGGEGEERGGRKK
jgi:hypothetical protein